MSMFNFLKDDILLSMPNVQRRYKVTVLGDMVMGSFNNKTKVETEWILTILAVYNDSSVMLELITLDSDVIESSNEAFKELSIVANQFKKATQKVVCVIKKDGTILQLINIEHIREKWNRIKNEMITMAGQTTDIEDFFKINNEKFSSDEVLTALVSQMEFFKVYFNGLYGTYIPAIEQRKSENALKTNTLNYGVEYTKIDEDVWNQFRIKFKSIDYEINSKWIETAYKGFPLLVNINYCKPKFNIEGNYVFDKASGLINEATFIWDENVSDMLKLRTEYQISKIKV